jgi:hypothetical protein
MKLAAAVFALVSLAGCASAPPPAPPVTAVHNEQPPMPPEAFEMTIKERAVSAEHAEHAVQAPHPTTVTKGKNGGLVVTGRRVSK